jgi:hypothetical protein
MTSRNDHAEVLVAEPDEITDGVILEASPIHAGGTTVFVCQEQNNSAHLSRRFHAPAIALCFVLLCALAVALFLRAGYFGEARIQPQNLGPLVSFHHRMLAIGNRLDSASATFDQSSEKATRERDLVALFDAANGYGAELEKLKTQTASVSRPYLRNNVATQWADKAARQLENRILTLQLADHLVIDAVDFGEFRPSAFRAVKIAERTSAEEASEENIAIRRSYEALGVPPQLIDFAHGGVLD